MDAEYKFMWYNIGAHGSTSDCAVFNASTLKAGMDLNVLGLPQAVPLPNDDRPIPYHVLGDDAFPLRTWLVKPFSGRNLTEEERIFNYR